MDKNYTFTKKVDATDNVVLTITIKNSVFVEKKEKVFNSLASKVEISGFRKGKAPKAMIEARLGPDLFEKTLNELLPEITDEIIKETDLQPLTQVKYEVKKVSEAEGVEYTAEYIKYPIVEIGDLKKIKIKEPVVEVTDAEVESELDRIVNMYSKQSKHVVDETADKSKTEEKQEEPELTDELVQSLGLGVKTVDEFKKVIKEQIGHQKLHEQENVQVYDAMKQATKLSKVPAPEKLVAQEVAKQEAEYVQRIEQLGLKLDDFLKTQNTTLDDLKKNWESEAEQQVKNDLLLYEIVKQQDIKVSNEEIQAQIDGIKDEKLVKQYDSYQGRMYIANVILQQKAMKWFRDEVGLKELHPHNEEEVNEKKVETKEDEISKKGKKETKKSK